MAVHSVSASLLCVFYVGSSYRISFCGFALIWLTRVRACLILKRVGESHVFRSEGIDLL